MKSLQESLLDDDDKLFVDTGEKAWREDYIKKNWKALGVYPDAYKRDLMDQSSSIHLWSFIKNPIPDYIKYNHVYDMCILDTIVSDFVKNWELLPYCDDLDKLEIYPWDQKTLGDLGKIYKKIDNIHNINIYFDPQWAPQNADIFANTKFPVGKKSIYTLEFIGDQIGDFSIELTNIKGMYAKYLIIDERIAHFTDWDPSMPTPGRVKIKPYSGVEYKIEQLIKNNHIDNILISFSSIGTKYKSRFYRIDRASKGYKLTKI